MRTPIFIITKDRVTVLKKSIESFLKLKEVEIIIHDNNSTYPQMVAYLNQLEREGVKVCRHPDAKGTFYDISDSVYKTILEWYETNDSPYYVVTDPDIELEQPCVEMLEFYKEVLLINKSIPVVGPMLRIDDIPDCFSLKEEMVESHKIQFWDKKPTSSYKDVNLLYSGIDTTFGMYRKDFKFKRLNLGLRVYEPYMARHLDWYMDTNNLSEEEKYYIEHASAVSTLSHHVENGTMEGYKPPKDK